MVTRVCISRGAKGILLPFVGERGGPVVTKSLFLYSGTNKAGVWAIHCVFVLIAWSLLFVEIGRKNRQK